MTRLWAIPVPVLPDELFSTWLVRAALTQACDPLDLTGSLWPRWRAWTVDLDRGLSDERRAVLASRTGVDATSLEAATLRPLVKAVAPSVRLERAVWPWVLALGSRNRRRRGGLQFCPICLREDSTPYFRRTWRLAWWVGCPKHRTLLADHCQQCQGMVEPHRLRFNDLTLSKCACCGDDLRRTTTEPACPDALKFQGTADTVLINGRGTWASVDVSCETWFQQAEASSRGPIRRRGEDKGLIGITRLAMNFQRPSERALRLRMAFRAMQGEHPGHPICPTTGKPPRLTADAAVATVSGGKHRSLPHPREQEKVQGEWVRLLRRVRVGHR